ncbi:MAG: HAD-IIIA family hydrolase, partial [Terriglobales bacterium]
LVVVVSNQPGIARGRFTVRVLKNVERKLMSQLAKAGAWIDASYYCLHHPEARVKRLRKRCACRKPGIGMLKAAARQFGLSLKDCYMVGDNITDIATGRRAGCKTIFIGRWKCELCQLAGDADNRPDFVARDLWSAARIIREQSLSAATLPPRSHRAPIK